jgi:hypothetical protein
MYNILDVFDYNQHFVAMMNIINFAKLNKPTKGHKHHIIPRSWFKRNGYEIDNSKDNLILLTAEDHLKVHKLAVLCAKDTYIKGAMLAAVGLLSDGERPLGIHPSEETKAKIKASVHKWYNDNREEHINKTKEGMKKVPYEKLAYWKGKHVSESTKNKLRISTKSIVDTARIEYKEYKDLGGELMWNEWRHKIWKK